jgi:hypothetical protein
MLLIDAHAHHHRARTGRFAHFPPLRPSPLHSRAACANMRLPRSHTPPARLPRAASTRPRSSQRCASASTSFLRTSATRAHSAAAALGSPSSRCTRVRRRKVQLRVVSMAAWVTRVTEYAQVPARSNLPRPRISERPCSSPRSAALDCRRSLTNIVTQLASGQSGKRDSIYYEYRSPINFISKITSEKAAVQQLLAHSPHRQSCWGCGATLPRARGLMRAASAARATLLR